MAVESMRGCGYRKVGGLYLVGPAPDAPCGRMPIELHVCPTCGEGIKQTRGWTWINPGKLLTAAPCRQGGPLACVLCPLSNPAVMGERAGLLWVGGQFYPEPADWEKEARTMGISRRIVAVPRGFKVGEHWVLIAHPKAIKRLPATPEEEAEVGRLAIEHGELAIEPRVIRKGIITVFRPTAIEKIITESQSKNATVLADLMERGISPVVVPDNDPDHAATKTHEIVDQLVDG